MVLKVWIEIQVAKWGLVNLKNSRLSMSCAQQRRNAIRLRIHAQHVSKSNSSTLYLFELSMPRIAHIGPVEAVYDLPPRISICLLRKKALL